MQSVSSLQSAFVNPRNRLAQLLVVLALVTILMLVFAVSQSREEVKIAYDINRSGSLRYRSLYIYSLIHLSHKPGDEDAMPGRFPAWTTVLREMEQIREELRTRYPLNVAQTDQSWNAFSNSLKHRKTVDWVTTNTFREDANLQTNEIERQVRQHMERMTLIYAFGIASFAFALPWGFILFADLRETQKQLAQENLEREAAAHRFASLFGGIPIACYSFDKKGRILIWNTTAENIFGKTAAEVVGKPVWEIISTPEDSQAAQYVVSRVINGYEYTDSEWRYKTPDGHTRYLLSNIFPLREGGDAITGGISSTLDITARKEAEDRLHSVLVGVRCMVWDAVVEEAPEPPVYRWDTQLWNERAAQQLVPLDTTGTSYIEAWLKSRDDDQVQMDDNSAQAFREGLPGYTQEFRCRDRFGVVHWLSEDARIEPLDMGRWRVIGVCTDITARKEAEERLQALTQELERSNAALQDFASIASHDLKEPLRKIQTFGGMLARKADNIPPDAKSYLDRMLAAANRMQSLIDGLLSYSRVTTKASAFVQVDLNDIVKGVLNDLEVRIQEVTGTVLVAPLPTVLGDALQMRQLFQNLIGNALKFHKDEEPSCIHIAYTRSEGKHIITVTDNGIGFAPKDGIRIFEVFERLDGSGREGTGIGLAICRKIVERHGGTLTATGQPGVGATFTMIL